MPAQRSAVSADDQLVYRDRLEATVSRRGSQDFTDPTAPRGSRMTTAVGDERKAA
jgi:hypothetical protein